jgi:large subunit ribosomal protein L31
MKAGVHPDYREVVSVDVSNNFSFKTRSTINTRETIKWEDGNEYPLAKIETSSESHPFYTRYSEDYGARLGRVEKFRQKFGAKARCKIHYKELIQPFLRKAAKKSFAAFFFLLQLCKIQSN